MPHERTFLIAAVGYAPVRERWWPVKLDVGITQIEHTLRVAPLDGTEDLAHDADVFFGTHH